MNTDRELLELAAKAAGYKVVWNEHWECFQHVNPPPDSHGTFRHPWVPLDDDGDALRLAVDAHLFDRGGLAYELENAPRRDYAAARRVIVIAAAESGRAA